MVEKDTVRKGYDVVGETYTERRNADTEGVDVLVAFLDGLPEGARLLDAGCGQGTPVLDRLGGATAGVGIDLSRGQLERASDRVPGTPLAQSDMAHLPFDAGTFDAVTALYSLIHVPEDERGAVLEEFARVLTSGGHLLLTEGTDEWQGSNPDWLDAGAAMEWDIVGPEATREHLRAAGFEVVEEWEVREALEDEDGSWQLFEAELVG